ncbi:hypothetical protein ACVW00_003472 [Marmoricola sp. URHA0025 HA25]
MSDSRALCPACDGSMELFDTAVVLAHHDATYHRCRQCGLVAARDTPWLEEAYASPIHDADVGLLRRARRYSAIASAVIRFEGLTGGRFLDWAGGYGVLTQVMRDKGHDYWHHDAYAQPVFARDFRDDGEGRVDLVTAFEVMEHLASPREELAGIAKRSDLLLFTTELVPDPAPRVADWWYYMPDVGQHITLHTEESLRHVGDALGYRLTTNGRNWHLFHRNSVSPRTRLLLSSSLNRKARTARNAVLQARQKLRG